MSSKRVTGDQYVETEYLQFSSTRTFRWSMSVLGLLVWPLAIPLALLSRLSDIVFRTCSELLSLLPYFPGVIVRYEFYRFALARCGKNVLVEFGAIFIHRDVDIGSNVLIGRYSIVHHVRIGNDVLIGERCTLLSGSRQHRYARVDMPINRQGGAKRRIVIDDDCWLGSHAVVMNDIGRGAIVAAGAVVLRQVAPLTIVAGVPATQVGRRESEKSRPDGE